MSKDSTPRTTSGHPGDSTPGVQHTPTDATAHPADFEMSKDSALRTTFGHPDDSTSGVADTPADTTADPADFEMSEDSAPRTTSGHPGDSTPGVANTSADTTADPADTESGSAAAETPASAGASTSAQTPAEQATPIFARPDDSAPQAIPPSPGAPVSATSPRPPEPSARQPISVLVVDDHPMWRDGVSRDLTEAGFEVSATADGVGAAARRAAAVRPDVVLMDMQLPDGNGAQATGEILRVSPGSRVLVLSASAERADVLEAIKAGATGYLVKSASAAELIAAVHATAAGQAVFTPGLAGLVLGEYRRIANAPADRDTPHRPALTDRETEVLRLVAKGLSAKQIATRLHLSHRTVENHVQATLRKLQLANRVELTRYAIEQGLE